MVLYSEGIKNYSDEKPTLEYVGREGEDYKFVASRDAMVKTGGRGRPPLQYSCDMSSIEPTSEYIGREPRRLQI